MRSDWLVRYFKTIFLPYPRERNSEENARDHYIRSGDVYRARLLELYLHRRICHCSGSFESRATFGIFSLFLWNPNNREMTRLSRGNSEISIEFLFEGELII